jgi:mannose-1-phosphate guanylyltransferase
MLNDLKSNTRIVILAGGQGTRFWPQSRERFPKQFLSVSASGESLIQATARRVADLSDKPALVVTNHAHVALVEQHLPEVEIVAEPQARNTAAAVGLAAAILAKENPEAVMVVLSADHVISREPVFVEVIKEAVSFAASQADLLTIGITPSFPHTGFGYIQCGASLSGAIQRTECFHEKPSLDKATAYLADGSYYWNSGMFVWKASVLLDALAKYTPEIFNGVNEIAAKWGTKEQEEALKEIFPSLPSLSVDVAVMEKATNRATITGRDFGWSDVGSWNEWGSFFSKDTLGNVAEGSTTLVNVENSIVVAKKRHVAAVGVSNLIVVETDDAVLVCGRDCDQDVKLVVTQLRERGVTELL